MLIILLFCSLYSENSSKYNPELDDLLYIEKNVVKISKSGLFCKEIIQSSKNINELTNCCRMMSPNRESSLISIKCVPSFLIAGTQKSGKYSFSNLFIL